MGLQVICGNGKEAVSMRFKKTSLLAKLLILAVAIFAIIQLVSNTDKLIVKRKEADALQESLLYEEQEKAQLMQDIEDYGSDESVKAIARSRLHMVEAGEIVFRDADMHD
jgi:cell division protein FtsB